VILRVDQLYTLCIVQGKNLRQAVQWKIADALQSEKQRDANELEILDRCVANAWDAHGIRMLLDAHEELTSESERGQVLKLLQDNLEAGECPFIHVSRPQRAGPITLHKTARTLYLAPFDPTRDIPLFIDKWFHDIPEKTSIRDNLKELVGGNSRLAGVCRIPLLLAFLCLAAEHGDILDEHGSVVEFSTRVALYRCLLNGLLKTWPRQFKPTTKFSDLKDEILRHIGWLQLSQPQTLVGRELIKDLIKWSEQTYRWNYENVKALLTELTGADCVLRPQLSSLSGEYRYFFFHASVAEYYAALEATGDIAVREQLLASLSETRWYGTFAMFVAMSNNPSPLILGVGDSTALDSLAKARLIDQCVSECGDLLASEDFAQCVWIAQSCTPLPWHIITAYDAVCIGLERLSDDVHSREMLTLINEIRNRSITLPDELRPGKKRFQYGLPKTLAALNSPHAITRWAALWILAVVSDTASALRVAPLLSNPNPAFRGMAAWLLSLLDHKASCGDIRKLLHDTDWMVRKAAASSLGRLEDSLALDELLIIAQNDRAEVIRSAAWALSRLAQSKKVLPESLLKLKDFFVPLIDSPDPDIIGGGCAGIAGLVKAGLCDLHDLMPRIQALLSHDDPDVNHSAAFAIAALAEPVDLPLLQSMAADSDANLRASAASGLKRMKPADNAPLLVKLLTDHDSRVQWVALGVLYKLSDQPLVETELARAIKTVDEQEAVCLMRALVVHKRDDSKPASHIEYQERDALKSEIQDWASGHLASQRPNVCACALNVLQRMPDNRAIVPCLKLMNDDDAGVRASACRLAAALSIPTPLRAPVLEKLRKLQKNPDENVRVVNSAQFAIRALSSHKTFRG
jgi:HEAT repeat protein